MRSKKLIILLVLSLLLTGCPEKRVLDQLGIINARGIDVENENDKIKVNFVIFQFEERSQKITKIVSGEGSTVNDALHNANYETNFLLQHGKIQIDLYGKETAEKGIQPLLDSLNRDPNTPDTMFLAVSNTTAEEILTVQEQNISMNIGQFLHDTIEKSTKSDNLFPQVSLQKFMLFLEDVGRDPILPIFTFKEEVPKITSIGVFKTDKLVGELPIKNVELINILYHRVKQAWIEVSIPTEPFQDELKDEVMKQQEDISLNLSIKKNKSNTKLIDKENLKFETNIKLNVNLIESSVYESLNMEDVHIVKKLEDEIEKKLEKRYDDMLKYLQEVNSDVLSYGAVYRQNNREHRLKKSEWRKLFPNIDVKYNIDVNLIQSGESL